MNYADLAGLSLDVKLRTMLESPAPCTRNFSEGNCGAECERKPICANRCVDCLSHWCDCKCPGESKSAA